MGDVQMVTLDWDAAWKLRKLQALAAAAGAEGDTA